MAGCTRRQRLWRVLVPTARPTLMVGVNQVIMLALNMVIISSMIGAGGLGYDVLLALRALKIGQGMEAGIAIVVLAIALDRLSQAAARRRPAAAARRPAPFIARNPASGPRRGDPRGDHAGKPRLCPRSASCRHRSPSRRRRCWKAGVDWITVNFFDVDRGVPRRAARLCAQPGARLLREPAVARRRRAAPGPRRLQARRRAARARSSRS